MGSLITGTDADVAAAAAVESLRVLLFWGLPSFPWFVLLLLSSYVVVVVSG